MSYHASFLNLPNHPDGGRGSYGRGLTKRLALIEAGRDYQARFGRQPLVGVCTPVVARSKRKLGELVSSELERHKALALERHAPSVSEE